MCSVRDLEYTRLIIEVKRNKPWLIKTNVLATVGYLSKYVGGYTVEAKRVYGNMSLCNPTHTSSHLPRRCGRARPAVPARGLPLLRNRQRARGGRAAPGKQLLCAHHLDRAGAARCGGHGRRAGEGVRLGGGRRRGGWAVGGWVPLVRALGLQRGRWEGRDGGMAEVKGVDTGMKGCGWTSRL
jgi:hypothetical protein